MIPGVNPRQMRQMMKRMGIQQQDINALEVVIRLEDKDIVISNPSVARVNMMGQDTFQISGSVSERSRDTAPSISEEDIETVMSQTGATKEEAQKAIEDSGGDLAEAIISLKE